MDKKILLLGNRGKMGMAVEERFKDSYTIIGKHSSDFDAQDFTQVETLVRENSPDIVINAAAFAGIDLCEKDAQKAFLINTLYPKFLAEMSIKYNFLLVHFSTDAVFNGRKNDFYVESDAANPVNIYGLTKFGADSLIQAIARKYYIFRISILFGPSVKNNQFVEKMLQRVKDGQDVLRISADIVASPTYSRDIAYEMRRIMEAEYEFGLYHLINEGRASLYDLIEGIVKELRLKVKLVKASYKDFPSLGVKNTYTPLCSEKLSALRPWREAVRDYCSLIAT